MELLERFALGDLDAFEMLFRQYQAEVYSWAVALTRNPAAAEDIMLETFWRIHRAHARFDPRRSFGAWARRIATNLAMDSLRRSRREPAADEPALESTAAPTVGDPAVQDEQRRCMRSAFAKLPVKLRTVAALALIEQKPYGEIVEALGISVEAVKSREFRAIRLLRKELTRMGVTP